MNNARQYLVHLTSRGETVASRADGGVSQFQCYTKQPMKDVNRFGLVQYAIPKRQDHLQHGNNTFTIEFKSAAGQVDVEVKIPELDYTSALASQATDTAGDGAADLPPISRFKNGIAFDEVLLVI